MFAEIPCNWLQCQENSIDPLHFEWMHMNWSVRLADKSGPYSPRHLRLEFEEFDYGFVYRRLREGMKDSDSMWTTGRVCLWPNALFHGRSLRMAGAHGRREHVERDMGVHRVPRECEPYVQEDPGVARSGQR